MEHRVTENDAALVDAWLDGQLEPDQASALAERLRTDPVLREEEARLRRLHQAFELSTVEVREGFAEAVMARLPRRAKASRLGIAVLVAAALAGIAIGLGAFAGNGVAGALTATLADYAATVLVVGAGLVGASWRQVGEGARAVFALEPANVAIAVAVLAACCFLLVALLRRRRAAVAVERARRRE